MSGKTRAKARKRGMIHADRKMVAPLHGIFRRKYKLKDTPSKALISDLIAKETGWVKTSNDVKFHLRYIEEVLGGDAYGRKKAEKKKSPQKSPAQTSYAAFNAFYLSKPWQKMRYKVLTTYGRRCMCCGTTSKEIHVDHIKPRSKYQELELEFDNLQVLCVDCNFGKGGDDETDWRPRLELQEPVEVVGTLH